MTARVDEDPQNQSCHPDGLALDSGEADIDRFSQNSEESRRSSGYTHAPHLRPNAASPRVTEITNTEAVIASLNVTDT